MSNQKRPPQSQILQAESFDLWGSRLIEASAGTGKTWTIAALYLRLVLGHGGEHAYVRALRPPEILVMTFTRAATRELSDRIRERLLTAAQCFRGETVVACHDDFLRTLINDYEPGLERSHAAWLLASAAEGMDDASVHTIDAWCQRMLKEHAFDSGNLFDEELVADEESMRTEAVQDYWRQSCYPLAAVQLSQVLAIWATVDALITDMRTLMNQDIPVSAGNGSLSDVLTQRTAQRADALKTIKAGWAIRAQSMQDWLDIQTKTGEWDGRKLSPKNYEKWLATLKDWANGLISDDIPDLKTGWARFTPEGLMTARKSDSPGIELPAEFIEFAQFKNDIHQLPKIDVAVRLHAAACVSQRLIQLKRQTGSFGFSDMLERLNAALQGANGAQLRERILAQYPVILIDEFQDTSPLQYRIFDQIYQTQANDPHSALLLIGDPKQSIYGFRGADIYSYLQAKVATAGRHYVLQTNYRSTNALVGVVNHWFAHADAHCKEGAFMYRTAHDNPLSFEPVLAKGRAEQLASSQGPIPAMTLVHDLELRNADDTRQHFAARCAEQIVCWLNDPKAGFNSLTKTSDFKPLRPADIAILVRTGKEAAAIRRELERRAIASVYLSDKDSVFASREAHDLVHWLRAVATPQDVRLARAALATGMIGLSLAELSQLASCDEVFDARCEQLRALHMVWQSQGVLAMLRQTVHQLGLAARWLGLPDGERKLTNYLHLAELLQTASSLLDGDQALIRWLLTEISEGSTQGDEQVVRLESDADLVKVVTIHKSKGLEYPIVCLPYSTSYRAVDAKSSSFLNLPDEAGHRKLSLQFSEDDLAMADRDRLREDLRLLYVALTRARHSVWVGFSAVKKGNGAACLSHNSAAGYALGGVSPIEAPDWITPLQQFAASCQDMVLEAAVQNASCTRLKQRQSQRALQERPDYQAVFERNWTIGSFSRLAKDLTQATSDLSPLMISRSADDEYLETDKAASTRPAQSGSAWHKFTRGPQAGNFLHDQLEWLAADGFALPLNDQLAARLRRRCERAGFGAQAEEIIFWLTEIVQTRLPGPDAALIELTTTLPEMEFWLPAARIEAQEIDALCRLHLLSGIERPGLAVRQLHGMLLGFADLVFEHKGKYWVLDYKSNHLGNEDAAYDSDTLARSMAQHRYDVQAAIYMLALHRLLKSRLGAHYHPEQHLGGAVYLFLRGIKGTQNGVCLIPASLPLLDALDVMLDGVTA